MNEVCVYLIQAGNARFNGPVKIGIAGNPALRLADLQVANYMQLRLRRVFAFESRADAQVVEQALHKHYYLLRVRGEWFKADFTDEEVAGIIDEILVDQNFKRSVDAAKASQPKGIKARRKAYYRALMVYRRANPEVSNNDSRKLLRGEWNL